MKNQESLWQPQLFPVYRLTGSCPEWQYPRTGTPMQDAALFSVRRPGMLWEQTTV
jgi:hypothetical protein